MYSNPVYSIIKMSEMVVHVEQMGEKNNACRILVRKPEGKKSPRKSRHRWEGNIKIDLKKGRIGRYGLNWLGSE
jgi:hypothetical protein